MAKPSKKLEVILLVLTTCITAAPGLGFGREDVWTSSFEQVDGEPPRESQHHFIAEEGFLGKSGLSFIKIYYPSSTMVVPTVDHNSYTEWGRTIGTFSLYVKW